MRRCPVCRLELVGKRSRGVEVDICPSCTGLWLDEGEFDAVVAHRLGGGVAERFLEEGRFRPTVCRECSTGGQDERCVVCASPIARACPVDGGAMEIVFAAEMELDRCPSCRGIWLDGDERRALGRGQSAGPVARRAPAPAASSMARSCSACGASVEVLMSAGGAVYCQPCVRRFGGDVPTSGASESTGASGWVTCVVCSQQRDPRRCMHRVGVWFCELCVLEDGLVVQRYLGEHTEAGREASAPPSGVTPLDVMTSTTTASKTSERRVQEVAGGQVLSTTLRTSYEVREQVIAPAPAERDEGDEVLCAGCGGLAHYEQCARRGGDFFCESCVVAGRFPSSTGTSAQAVHAEAIASFARAKAQQAERKAVLRELGTLRPVRHGFGRPRIAVGDAIRSAVLRVRLLFD